VNELTLVGGVEILSWFYSLVERHHDGRPDMIGMEAVNQLLVALEVYRVRFLFHRRGIREGSRRIPHCQPWFGGPV
jgi:ESX secretion system protein EccA